jgi:tricorn protease
VHGEIFTVRIEDNKTVQITETPYREYLPRWSSNGKYLAYLSDESGKYEIWSIPSLGGAPEQLTETQKEIVEYDWSPNGEKFYLITHDYSLYLMDSDGGNQTLLHESDGYGLYTPSWSADNKWLAYEKHDDNDQGNIFVASVEELNPTNIIVDTLYHYQVPIWSNDGKMIFFESNRDDDNWRLWAVRLTEEDYPYKKDLDRAEEEAWENIGKETETDEENEENEIEEEVSVEIKFEGIEERVHKLLDKPRTSTWTFAPSLSPDGKSIAFLVNPPDETENELWHLVLGEDEAEKIGTFSDLNQYNYSPDREKANYYNRTFMWHPEGKKVFYRTSSGELKSVEISGGKSEMVKFNAEMKIDEFGEFDQMYTECWRTLKNYFYDEEMHGVDWQSVYDKYYPQLQGIRTKGELFSIIREMYGELNASHLGIWGYGGNGRNLGYLGINIEPADNGYYRITEVLPDGPADTDDANQLNVGEYIISVDRDEITTDDNFYKYFLGTIGKRLRIEVSEDPNSGENRVVWITPCGNWEFQTKHYERWVTERKEIVTEKSGEKIGYIHIRSMNGSSFEQFKKELFYEVDSKDALILDVRFNGGGYTHDMIMDILEREPMMYRKTRLRHKKRIQPDKMWGDKPLILLINEHSFSDAEIFPHIFRVRELGTIVGVPTAGGVIGTGGIKLIDGSHFRVPRTGWYSLDGKNLENWGIEPDIYIENHPNELEKGIDSQLLKAIEIAKEKIE